MLIYAVGSPMGGHDPPARRPYSGQRRGRLSGRIVWGRGLLRQLRDASDASCIFRWLAARPLQPVVGRRRGEGSMQVDRRGQDTWTQISIHMSKIHCCTPYSMQERTRRSETERTSRRDVHESESARERAACL